MTAPHVRAHAGLVAGAVLTGALAASLLGSGTSTAASPAPGRLHGPPTSVVPAPPALRAGAPTAALLPAPRRAPVLSAATGVVRGPRPVPSSAVAGPPPVVGPGASLAQVREAQRLLNAHGAALRVDGDWGPATTRAVRGFQARAGLPVDGRVGPSTRAALRRR